MDRALMDEDKMVIRAGSGAHNMLAVARAGAGDREPDILDSLGSRRNQSEVQIAHEFQESEKL